MIGTDLGGTLSLVCLKCTREESYFGKDRLDAANHAKAAGWVTANGSFVCPKCPAFRRPLPKR